MTRKRRLRRLLFLGKATFYNRIAEKLRFKIRFEDLDSLSGWASRQKKALTMSCAEREVNGSSTKGVAWDGDGSAGFRAGPQIVLAPVCQIGEAPSMRANSQPVAYLLSYRFTKSRYRVIESPSCRDYHASYSATSARTDTCSAAER